MTVLPDGKIENGGHVLEMAKLKDFIKPLEKGIAQTIVVIRSDANTPVGYVDDLKQQLREAGILKVSYARPAVAEGVVVRHLPLAKGGEGLTVQKAPATPTDYPKEIQGDICLVKLNAGDRIFFKDGAYQDDDEIVRLGTDFLREHGAGTLFLFTHDKGTSYGAYVHMQDLLQRCYKQVRGEKAQELYGKSLLEISDSQLTEIYKLYPVTIVEQS